MSLFSSIQLAGNALKAQQIGMQVVGQNIANANTPGYLREEVIFTPAPTQRIGDLLLGLGVDVTAVVQKVDRFLEQRLLAASSDRAGSAVKEQTYAQLEGLIGELSDTDLSTTLSKFFAGISEILNQPESVTVRNLAVLQGQTLTQEIELLASRTGELRSELNDRVIAAAEDINRLLQEIRTLNLRIAETEGSDVSESDAVGLRDQRGIALTKLSQLIDIKVEEQPNGQVNVFANGEFLVFEATVRSVEVQLDTDRGLSVATLVLKETQSPLQARSGEVKGLLASRDDVLGGFLDGLDELTAALVFEFNKLFTSGQGLHGYDEATSEFAVTDADAALDAAGLVFTPTSGAFQLQVFDRETGLTETTEIQVDLHGLDTDTTFNDLVAQLDAVDGISAAIDLDGKLAIRGDSPTQEFAFGSDTSGVLAALGIGTFFTGSTARTVGINQAVIDDPARFAASRSGVGGDTANAEELAAFIDRPLSTVDNQSLANLYDALTGGTAQASSGARAVAEGFRVFEEALQGQKLAVSGVSLDEEVVRLVSFQRAFQATARYISTLSELFGVLVNL